jgi:hypothetical protein
MQLTAAKDAHMKLIPKVPSGSNAPKEAAGDFAGAVYVVAVVTAAVATVAIGRQWIRKQLEKRNASASHSTPTAPAQSLFTV